MARHDFASTLEKAGKNTSFNSGGQNTGDRRERLSAEVAETARTAAEAELNNGVRRDREVARTHRYSLN
ncbi:hypothetical protein KSP39_PZI014943 [Platanthera zijinensis]|uniref:Uncharacterized protein n=1 Tax=Platanthera zijinensis TaxID=2320716 RepID=A0AAP0BAE9_9ASPA